MSESNKRSNFGDFFEAEVANYFFTRGYFVRRRISLKAYFYPKFLDVTDIDVYGVYIGPDFSIKTIGVECKAGDFRKMDRIIWLLGLKKVINADQVYLATSKPVDMAIKSFAQMHGISLLTHPKANDKAGLKHLATDVDVLNMVVSFNDVFKNDNSLFKLYWFLRSKYWFNDPYVNVITIMESFSIVLKKLEELKELNNEIEKTALKWLITEAVILLSVALLKIASQIHGVSKKHWENYVTLRLTYGKIDPSEAQKLLRLINEYIEAYLEQKGLRRDLGEKIELRAPKYVRDLIDVLDRLLAKPDESCDIPRILDQILYCQLFKSAELNNCAEILDVILRNKNANPDIALKMGKNVVNLFVKYYPRSIKLFKAFLLF